MFLFLPMASRCLLALAQLSLIFFAAQGLSKIEQGFFSASRSLMAMTVFMDLGLSIVLVQVVAHLWAMEEPRAELLARLRGLLRFCLRWYLVACIAAVAMLIVLGMRLFARAPELAALSYLLPWLCICASAGLGLLLLPFQGIVEGSDHALSIALMRGVQAAVGATAFGVTAWLGGGLWSVPALTVASLLTGWTWIALRHRDLLLDIWRAPPGASAAWRKDILPFQWRMAVSWMSGWIIYQLYVPVLFVHAGAISAGQMGLTMEACAGITSLGAAWVGIKAPTWGGLVARGDFLELNRQFRTSSRYALFVVIIASTLFGCGIMALNWIQHPLATRFLPPHALAPLLLAAILNQSIFAMATYLRAHKREPYLAPTVVGAVALGTWTLVAGPLVGATGLAYAHLVVTLIVGWAWGSLIFRHCRTTWHNESVPKAIPSDSRRFHS